MRNTQKNIESDSCYAYLLIYHLNHLSWMNKGSSFGIYKN